MNTSEPPGHPNRFFQFGVRQLLVLLAVLSLLLVILSPRLQRVYRARKLERDFRATHDVEVSFVHAVGNNDVARARKALTAGAHPDQIIGEKSLLLRCIESGRTEMLDLLVEFGADVDRVEKLQNALVGSGPPLFAAISASQPAEVRLRMIRILVEQGADVRRRQGQFDAMDAAVYHGDPQVADLLKEYGLPYGPREMATFNRLEELKRVVQQNPDVLKERFQPIYAANEGQGPTLLGTALQHGHREMALFLIEAGAPLDTVEGLGQTLLHLAARGGDADLIRLLVKRGLDVHAQDKYNDTPLGDSAWRAPPAAISALIEAGADVNATGINGRTALHQAVFALRQLADQSAAYSQRVDVIKLLLAAGADPTITDARGQTAADLARESHPQIAVLLGAPEPSPQPHR